MHSKLRNDLLKSLTKQSTDAQFRAFLHSLKNQDWILAKSILIELPLEDRNLILSYMDQYEAKTIAYLMFSLSRAIEIITRYNILTKQIGINGMKLHNINPELLVDMKNAQKSWYEEVINSDSNSVLPQEDFEYFYDLDNFLDISETKGVDELVQIIKFCQEES